MRFIKWLVRFFWKLISILPALLVNRFLVYHEHRWNKSVPSKQSRMIIANDVKHAKRIIFYTNYFKYVHGLFDATDYTKGKMFWSKALGNCFKDEKGHYGLSQKVSKRGEYAFYLRKAANINNENAGIDPYVIYYALKHEVALVPAYVSESKHWYERKKIIYGEAINTKELIPDSTSSEQVKNACAFISKKIAQLKHKQALYEKYDTYKYFSFKHFVLDFFRLLYFATRWFVFPTRTHYVGVTRKEAKRIKGRGLIAAKHRTFIDPLILYDDYRSRRPRIIIAKLLDNKFRAITKFASLIVYDRETSTTDPRMMLETLNILKAEGLVAIFPEGHLYKDSIGELSDGTAFFAMKTLAPIYPYYTVREWKPFHFNHIMIGKPLYIDKIFTEKDLENGDNIHKFTLMLKASFEELDEAGKKYRKKSKN